MKVNGRMSYEELQHLVAEIQDDLRYQQLKQVYQYKNWWMFKFQRISLIYEPAIALWVGSFTERTPPGDLHSVCIKLRKELVSARLQNITLASSGRTLVMEFKDFNLILELYAKGNLILTDKDNKIVVLTRIYDVAHTRHGEIYPPVEPLILESSKHPTYWKNELRNEICSIPNDHPAHFPSFTGALSALWELRYKTTATPSNKKVKYTTTQNIEFQISELVKKVVTLQTQISQVEDTSNLVHPDYEELEKLHQKRKETENKLIKAQQALEKADSAKPYKSYLHSESTGVARLPEAPRRWYHDYHWWYTKSGFLVVGGKSADQNEKLVKTYLHDKDYYFHTEQPGSGSFILFITNAGTSPSPQDLDETAEGVVAFSQAWKTGTGDKVYYVTGSQVSKTPPTGEFLTKGSFMIYGQKNFIRVDNMALGYVQLPTGEIMCAPYRVVHRISQTNIVKLTPKTDAQKNSNKKIVEALKKTFRLKTLPDSAYIFPFAANVSSK